MVRITINSEYLHRSALYENPDKCQLTINNKEFHVQMSHALCISEKIATIYMTDRCNRQYSFECPVKNEMAYTLFQQILEQGNISVEVIESVSKDLFEIGYVIGNRDLMKPYISSMNSTELSTKNVFELLQISKKFGSSIREISYIAMHICDFDSNFLIDQLADLEDHILVQILENSNLKITSEDFLLETISKLCEINPSHIKLFNYTHPEYATTRGINAFMRFVDKIINTTEDFPYIWQFMRKIMNNMNFPLKTDSPPNRYNTPQPAPHPPEEVKLIKFPSIPYFSKKTTTETQETTTNLLTNIVRQGKGEISVSSDEEMRKSHINSLDPNSDYYSKDQPNSWILATMHGEVMPTAYTVQSTISDNSMLLKTWTFEGITSDGRTILLDEHINDAFEQAEIRTFDIITQEKFSGFRLTQTGVNYDGDNELAINIFDVDGYFTEKT